MSKSITVETKKFLSLVDDLLITAEAKGDYPEYHGVHFQHARGAWEDEPGETDLLTGTSANGEVAGHAWIDATGEIDPLFISLPNLRSIKGVFSGLAKSYDEEHVIVLSHEAGVLTVKEYHGTIVGDEPTELQVPSVDESPFPLEGITKWLDGTAGDKAPRDVDGNFAVDENVTLWNQPMILLLKVAKRRKGVLRLYRQHAANIHRAQIGDTWRGAIKPTIPDADIATDAPDADLYV
jgi:hypothetical protein